MLQALKRIFKNNGFVAQTIIIGSVILAISVLGGLAFSGANNASAQDTPTITVTSPSGGETWKMGESYPITWTSQNLSSSELLSIYLINGDNWEASLSEGFGYMIAKNVPNTGSYNVRIPTGIFGNELKLSDKFKIILGQSNDSLRPQHIDTLYAVSDNYFSMPESQTQGTCTDSDGGKNYETPGWVDLSDSPNSSVIDQCYITNNGNMLFENSCENNIHKMSEYVCPNGCETRGVLPPKYHGDELNAGACRISASPYIEIFNPSQILPHSYNSDGSINMILGMGGMYAVKWQNVSIDAYPLDINLINNDTGDKSNIISSLSLDSSGQANYMWPVPDTLVVGSYKLELVGNGLGIESINFTIHQKFVGDTVVIDGISFVTQVGTQGSTPQNTGIIQQTEVVVTAPAVCSDATIKAVINAVGGCTEIDSSRFPNISKNCCGSAAVSVPPPADTQPSDTCDTIAKSVVSAVGGCTEIDASKFPNIAKSCCTSAPASTTVTKETLLAMLNDDLADGVISDQEKTDLLTALNSYLGQ